ncbi:MAG: hypothetical protein IT201_04890 [Thermoleophilia bacterium]|nr:hypothetical protein [Thermoleophilia bacterium]
MLTRSRYLHFAGLLLALGGMALVVAGIAAADPVNTSRPTISGTAHVGETLTASPGVWTDPYPISFSYQWQRCNKRGSSCQPIGGAVAVAYVVQTADLGSTLRVRVKATSESGVVGYPSEPTPLVEAGDGTEPPVVPPAPAAPQVGSSPTVSGSPAEGALLSATPGTWSGTAPIATAYGWERCVSLDPATACAAIPGATAPAYALTAADVDSAVRVRVTATNAYGSASSFSARVGPVAAAPPEPPPGPPGPPTGSGTLIVVTDREWACRGPLSAFGELPITVVSEVSNATGGFDAIRLSGCYGDGDPSTIDLILDVRGNGRDRGVKRDGVKIGGDTHDIEITGRVDCGARDPSVHQDAVQVMYGHNITFRGLVSGNVSGGTWTCVGSGGAFFAQQAKGPISDVVCEGCSMAVYHQGLNIGSSLRSGARYSTFATVNGPLSSLGEATDPVNVGNTFRRL